MSTRPTICFQPPNHVGLGHLNRLSSIALALRRIDPEIRSMFAVEGAAHVLLDALDVPYVPLPSTYVMNENKSWNSWTDAERSSLSLDAARAALASINPHLVLFDCFPSQSFLSAVIEKEVPIALCIREMGNLNKYLQEIQDLLPRVSLILIPHEAGAFHLPEAIRAKSRFVGRIMKPAPTLNQRTGGDGTNPRVVVCGGGGGYPGTFRFYNLAMKAISKLRETRRHVDARIVVGPLFREWPQLELISEVSVIPFDPNPFVTFASADLVISVAGYNTVTELQYLGTRTILLPAERLWDDQYARAENVATAHSHFRIFRGSDPGELAEAADEFLNERLPDTHTSLPEGASNAAYSLRSLVRRSSASA